MIDYFQQGHTINGAYYAAELRHLRQEIARKRRGKLTRGVLLLQDNAPAHTSQVAMTAATECGFEVLPHPPYSPVPKIEIQPSWDTVWKQRRRHRSERIFGGPGKGLLFGRNK